METTAGRRLRVADFSTHFSGPLAGQLLGQLDADVIKIEHPKAGDGNRGLAPLIAGEAMLQIALNSGKRSLTVNSRSPEWAEVVTAAARWADVLIVSGQPEALSQRGLDFESLKAANPRLVYCIVTGYGETGPWRDLPSHGLNTDALAGLVPVDWTSHGPAPRADYRSVGTTLAGVYGAFGIMAALYRRERGAGAQKVAVSIWEAAMWWSWRDIATHANLGAPWTAYKDLGSRYAMYRTNDERAVLVCPIERRFWHAFCDLLGLPADMKARGSWEANGMDFGERYPEERAPIGQRIAEHDLAHWTSALAAAEIPFAPLLHLTEAMNSDHARALQLLARTRVNGEEVLIVRSPVSIDSGAGSGRMMEIASPPALGEHNAAILAELRAYVPAAKD